ncbi:Copper homeostasis protein CutC [Frondihabitans sp. 762G35]|uniref:copper homeostasis protein CutC n=1 Tax=Frondihabitans sp. 762G35 TaxID=1446794 RepID=UPI000D21902A|nr:copper homeostasis protein CutC [Frondihabitans sp. 762G35]ARC58122.1 Copper homeostasis protein CutC [Frondihabitans sp. 762G35]
MTPPTPALEIAVTSPAGALVAARGGADRIELCTALELGGVTPSQGLVEACTALPLPVHVLVRPRPGDFVYDETEVALMEREVRAVVASGAAGVVVGALDARGGLDRETVARLVAAARSVRSDTRVTFHRAIDRAQDPLAVVAGLGALGVDRVLTSGGASCALDGVETLARLVDAAADVEVMAGGGVAPEHIGTLVDAGVAAVHLSAKRRVEPLPGEEVRLGTADASSHSVTDPHVVAAARAALRSAPPAR